MSKLPLKTNKKSIFEQKLGDLKKAKSLKKFRATFFQNCTFYFIFKKQFFSKFC